MERGSERYRFDRFVFDPMTGELLESGSPGDGPEARAAIRLPPQPALALSMLLENAGYLVTREALRDRIWPDTVVEFDKGLNFCIREVRAALGDRAASPTFVETLPRRGYRFIAPVEVLGGGRATTLPDQAPQWATSPARVAAVLGIGLLGVAVGLTRSEGVAYAPDPRARESAEFGGYLLLRGENDDVRRSVDYFREAVARDPEYARAYAGLGSAYLRLARVAQGKAALHRSLELDPGQWAPHVTLALRALYTEYDRRTAAHHFAKALEAAPDEVLVRHTYAWSRAVAGDLNVALDHMRAALVLDPVSPRVNGDVGRLFYLAGHQDEALAHCRRTSELTPETLRPRDCVVQALVEQGALAEARAEAAAIVRAFAPGPEPTDPVEAGAPAAGLAAYWRWVAPTIEALADRGEDSHVHAAAAWARLGETDRAFVALEAAYAARCPVLLQVHLDPALASLRNDPRFSGLLRRIGHTGSD